MLRWYKPQICYICIFRIAISKVTQYMSWFCHLEVEGIVDGMSLGQDTCWAADYCKPQQHWLSHCSVFSSFLGTKGGCFVVTHCCFSSRNRAYKTEYFKPKQALTNYSQVVFVPKPDLFTTALLKHKMSTYTTMCKCNISEDCRHIQWQKKILTTVHWNALFFSNQGCLLLPFTKFKSWLIS